MSASISARSGLRASMRPATTLLPSSTTTITVAGVLPASPTDLLTSLSTLRPWERGELIAGLPGDPRALRVSRACERRILAGEESRWRVQRRRCHSFETACGGADARPRFARRRWAGRTADRTRADTRDAPRALRPSAPRLRRVSAPTRKHPQRQGCGHPRHRLQLARR